MPCGPRINRNVIGIGDDLPMPIERTILPNMAAHPTAGAYVETYARHHVYGWSGCFACPELHLFGYMELGGIRRAILRAMPVVSLRSTEAPEPKPFGGWQGIGIG